MWSTVAISSAMWIGWARGKRTTARPMRMRWVRAAMALAIVMGEDKTLIGEKWYSASHTELTPRASAASTNAKHSAKASRSVIPSRHGNSMKSPKSKLADPGKVSLGDLRSWGLRCGDVHRDSPSAGGFHVGQSFLLGGIGIGEKLHLDPVRIQEVDAAGHAVVHDVVDGGPSLHQPFVGRLQSPIAFHLERKVIQADRALLCRPGPRGRFEQGEVVMHHAAGQKGARPVRAIPRHLEPHHIPIEPGGPFDVGDVEDDMPDLFWCAHSDSLLFQPQAGPLSTAASPLCRTVPRQRRFAQPLGRHASSQDLAYCLIPWGPAVEKAGSSGVHRKG